MTALVLTSVGVLLLLSAVITAAGASVFQIGSSRLRTLLEEGFQGAEQLAALRADDFRTRTGLRLVTRGLNLGALGLATLSSESVWGPLPAVVILGVGVVLVLAVTDVFPRALAARQPVRLALLFAPMLLMLMRGLRVVIHPVGRIEEAFTPSGEGRDDSPEARELREIQEIGQEEGVLGEHENLLVERAFRLDELTAWDVMTPRVDVFAWKDAQTLASIASELGNVPYSRVPVYGDSVDDVTGILYVREAYKAIVEGKSDLTLNKLSREPFFVPGSLSLSRLLRDFQARRIHMGIVADEFGGIDGLVTLEDVLEELVGEIVDETDVDEEELVRLSRTEALADAGVDLREINYALNLSLPTLEHRSLNGFILEELGYVPAVGEALDRGGVHIEIIEATETQVLRAKLTRLPSDSTPANPTE